MAKYTFEMSIEAPTAEDAEEKLAAAGILIQKLKTNELKKIASVVKNDPAKTAFAKKALGL